METDCMEQVKDLVIREVSPQLQKMNCGQERNIKKNVMGKEAFSR